MILHDPFIITARLLPGLRIGEGDFISIEYLRRSKGFRTAYRVTFDIAGKEYTDDTLKSGCQGGTLQQGMASLLSFLGAAAESYAYGLRTGCAGENANLFDASIVEWAHQNSDEISLLAVEIEETPDLIQE